MLVAWILDGLSKLVMLTAHGVPKYPRATGKYPCAPVGQPDNELASYEGL